MLRLLIRRITLAMSVGAIKMLIIKVIVVSIALSFAMLFPMTYLHGVGQLLMAGYDYSLNWIDDASMREVARQPFFSRAFLVFRQGGVVVEAGGREMATDLDLCETRSNQDLYYFSPNACLSQASSMGSASPTISVCLDVAKKLHISAGDTVRVDKTVDAVVDAVFESAYSDSDMPLVLMTYRDYGYGHMPEITCAYIAVTDVLAANDYFRTKFVGPGADEESIDYFRHVDNVSRNADIAVAQNEAYLTLGLVIALGALSLILLMVFFIRESSLRFRQYRKEFDIVTKLGATRLTVFLFLFADAVVRYMIAMVVSVPIAVEIVFPLLADVFLSWRSVGGFVLVFLCAIVLDAFAVSLLNTRRLFVKRTKRMVGA